MSPVIDTFVFLRGQNPPERQATCEVKLVLDNLTSIILKRDKRALKRDKYASMLTLQVLLA